MTPKYLFLILGIWLMAPDAQAQQIVTASPGRGVPFTALYRGGTSQNAYYIRHQGNKYQVWMRTISPIAGIEPDSLGWYRMTVLDTTANNRYNLYFTAPQAGAQFHLQGDGLMPGNPCFQLVQTAGQAPFIPAPPVQATDPWEPGYTLQGTSGRIANEAICVINPLAPSTLAEADQQYNAWREAYRRNQQHLDSLPQQIEVTAKPVLYLYPHNASADIEISLTLAPETQPLCYPALTPQGQWYVTAQPAPSGMLTVRESGAEYPSLFWEAHLPHQFPADQYREGWKITRTDLLPFLEARLNEMNFTFRERAEFIQYWLPVLSAYDCVFIHFAYQYQTSQGTEANASGMAYAELAPMQISPAPAHFLRVLMHWVPLDETAPVQETPSPQTLPRLNRHSYHALEWGGTQISRNPGFRAEG